MATEEGVVPRAASVGDARSRFWSRSVATASWAAAVAILVVLALVDLEGDRRTDVLAGLGAAAVLVVVGLVLRASARRQGADTERLRRDGRRAVAEVLELEILTWDDGFELTQVLLRFSGEDVPAFETVLRFHPDSSLHVGMHLRATVDPSDNLFTVSPLPLR